MVPGRQPPTGTSATGPLPTPGMPGASMPGASMPVASMPGASVAPKASPGPATSPGGPMGLPGAGGMPSSGSGPKPGPQAPAAGAKAAGSVSEAGPRAVNASRNASSSASGNASSTAAPAGVTLSPSVGRPMGGAAAGAVGAAVGAAAGAVGAVGVGGLPAVSPAGSSPVVVDAELQRGPKPWVLEMPGANRTLLLGCVLPFAGSDGQDVTGKAVHVAIKMALRDVAKLMKIPTNVNLTCLNSKVGSEGFKPTSCAACVQGVYMCAGCGRTLQDVAELGAAAGLSAGWVAGKQPCQWCIGTSCWVYARNLFPASLLLVSVLEFGLCLPICVCLCAVHGHPCVQCNEKADQ